MKLTNSKYGEISAVLIGEIVLRNAQRTGVVCGMRWQMVRELGR